MDRPHCTGPVKQKMQVLRLCAICHIPQFLQNVYRMRTLMDVTFFKETRFTGFIQIYRFILSYFILPLYNQSYFRKFWQQVYRKGPRNTTQPPLNPTPLDSNTTIPPPLPPLPPYHPIDPQPTPPLHPLAEFCAYFGHYSMAKIT